MFSPVISAHATAVPRPLAGKWACVDLETTGGSAGYHRIIEVGIVLIDDGVIVAEWSSLVDPECSISAGISAFTGITDAMVVGAPTFARIADEVLARCANRIFVAHNARFDYGFLRSEFRRLGRPFTAPVLCTVKLSRCLFPDEFHHNLDAVMERHQLTPRTRHRALGDAQAIAEFLTRLADSPRDTQLRSVIEALLRPPKLPPHLPAELLDELPESAGVYRFHGDNDELLYLHRADNLRTRVLEHFNSAKPSATDVRLGELVRRVSWSATRGPWGASLLEIAELRRTQPLFNARFRTDRLLWTIRLSPSHESCAAGIEPLDGESLAECFGTFRSAGAARRFLEQSAQRHHLCLAVLGLEAVAAGGSCMALHRGDCRGACVGREPHALHAARVRIALVDKRLREWPFAGRVAIRELRRVGDVELHVFQDWRYLGTARSSEALEELRCVTNATPFDFNVYRLLATALKERRVESIELPAAVHHTATAYDNSW